MLLVLYWIFYLAIMLCSASDDVIVTRDPHMWLDGLEICQELQLPSYAFLRERNKTFITNLHRHLGGMSGWLYGLEGSRKDGWKLFVIGSRRSDVKLRYLYKDTKTSVKTSNSQESYSDIPKKLNTTMNESLLNVEFHNIFNYIESRGLLGQEYWIRPVNESNLIQDTLHSSITVKCLLLDETGQLRSDDCSNKHKVICVNATLKPTLKYISPGDAIDEYKLPTTTTPLSETTTPVAKSTGTDQEVVVTTDLYRRPTQSAGPTENSSATMSTDNGSLSKEVQYVVIISSVGVVMTAVFVAICCCACRKTKKTKNGPKLSEVYSDTADSVIIRHRTSDSEIRGVSYEYATPQDGVEAQKAIYRISVKSDEYDCLTVVPQNNQRSNMTDAHLNVYSHIQIKQPDTSDESAYDTMTRARRNNDNIARAKNNYTEMSSLVYDTARQNSDVQNSGGDVQNSIGAVQNSIGAVQNSVGDVQNSIGAVQNSVGDVQNSGGDVQNSIGAVQNSVGDEQNRVSAIQNSGVQNCGMHKIGELEENRYEEENDKDGEGSNENEEERKEKMDENMYANTAVANPEGVQGFT